MQQPPCNHGRYAGHHQDQPHPSIGPITISTADPGLHHFAEIIAEVHQHGQQSAHMGSHVKHEALVRPAKHPASQDQVGGTGYRQELRQALDNGQHDDLQQYHFE